VEPTLDEGWSQALSRDNYDVEVLEETFADRYHRECPDPRRAQAASDVQTRVSTVT